MRFFACILSCLAWATTACNGPSAASGAAAHRPAAAGPPAPAPSPYEVRGIIDPGLNDLVLGAFLAPKGWLLRQGLRRQWHYAVPAPIAYLALTSPDGRSSLEFLPEARFHFTSWRNPPPYWDDPVEHPVPPQERYPLPPLAYLRQELLPRLARLLGQPLRLTAARGDSVLPTATGTLPPRATAAVEGVLPWGRRLRLATEIRYAQTSNPQATQYQWVAYTTLVQSDTALATCAAYSQVALQTMALNPAWLRQQQLLVQDGSTLDSLAFLPSTAPARARQLARLAAPPSAARTYQRQHAKQPSALTEYSAPAHPTPAADSTGGPVYHPAASQNPPTNAPLDPSRLAWAALQRREAAHYRRPLPALLGHRLMLAPPPYPPPRYRFSPRHY